MISSLDGTSDTCWATVHPAWSSMRPIIRPNQPYTTTWDGSGSFPRQDQTTLQQVRIAMSTATLCLQQYANHGQAFAAECRPACAEKQTVLINVKNLCMDYCADVSTLHDVRQLSPQMLGMNTRERVQDSTCKTCQRVAVRLVLNLRVRHPRTRRLCQSSLTEGLHCLL